MAGYRRNQCRRFFWLVLLIIALVCMVIAFASSAWVVTQSSVSPSTEIGLITKCHAGSCKSIPFSEIAHVTWQVVVVLLGVCMLVTFCEAIAVCITFRYLMNNSRALNIIKASGGFASLLMFVAMLLWPFGLDNNKDTPCLYNYPTKSYYMCDPWALGWAAYVMIVAMIFLAFSCCFSSLISSKPLRPETKKAISEHHFKQQDQRKGKKRRGSAPVPIDTPYYPAQARPAGAGLAAPAGGHAGAKGKYSETKFPEGSGARLAGVSEERVPSSTSRAAPTTASQGYFDIASRKAPSGYFDSAPNPPAAPAASAGYLDVGRSGAAAPAAAPAGYLDVGRSGAAAAAPPAGYLDVGRSAPAAADPAPVRSNPYLDPVPSVPSKASAPYMDPVPAPAVADAGAIPMAYLDVLNGLPQQPAFDSYFDASPEGMSETALPSGGAPFAGGYTDLLQSVMQFSPENAGGAAMFELPTGDDLGEFGFGTLGSNGTTVFNPLYTEGEEGGFTFGSG